MNAQFAGGSGDLQNVASTLDRGRSLVTERTAMP